MDTKGIGPRPPGPPIPETPVESGSASVTAGNGREVTILDGEQARPRPPMEASPGGKPGVRHVPPELLKLLKDPKYLAFRTDARAGYNELPAAADNLIDELGTRDARLSALRSLTSQTKQFHKQFLHSLNSRVVLIPSNLRAEFEAAQDELNALLPSDKIGIQAAEVDGIFEVCQRIRQATESIKAYANNMLAEESIFARYEANRSAENTSAVRRMVEERSRPALSELKAFQAHCQASLCAENLDFLTEVHLTRQLPPLSQIERYKGIFRDYVDPEAPKSVNIESTQRTAIQAAMKQLDSALQKKSKEPELAGLEKASQLAALETVGKCMDTAYEEVLKMTGRDVYARFKKASSS